METPADDLAARGRSIFDQLRDLDERGSSPDRTVPEDPTGLTVPAAEPTVSGDAPRSSGADVREPVGGGSARAAGSGGEPMGDEGSAAEVGDGAGSVHSSTGVGGKPPSDDGSAQAGGDPSTRAHGQPRSDLESAPAAGDSAEPVHDEGSMGAAEDVPEPASDGGPVVEAGDGREPASDGGSASASPHDRHHHLAADAERTWQVGTAPPGDSGSGAGPAGDLPQEDVTAGEPEADGWHLTSSPPSSEADDTVEGPTAPSADVGQGATGADPLDAAMTARATQRAVADWADVGDGDVDNGAAMFAGTSEFPGAPRHSIGSGHDEQLPNQAVVIDGAEQAGRVAGGTPDRRASVDGQRMERPQGSDGSGDGPPVEVTQQTADGRGAADAEEARMEDGSGGSEPPVVEPMTDPAVSGDGGASPGDGDLPADEPVSPESLAPSEPGRSPVLKRPLFHVEPETPAALSEQGSGERSGTVNITAGAAPPAAPAEESVSHASEFHVEPAGEGNRQDDAGIPTPAQPPTPVAVPAPASAPTTALTPPRPRRMLPRILAVANQKGGVGKTTTAVNLGAALAELGYRTLVVDLDPQGNATTGLGINAHSLQTSVYDVLMRELPIEDALEPTSVRNLFVVPATIDLAGAEIELVPAFSRELRLKRALDGVADDFDFTLIDCPPSLGLLTVNALAAAGEVVVPVQCEYYALEGLSALLRNVQLVQNNLNKALEVSTIILTMYDARTKLAEQVAQEVRSHFGNVVCRNLVPRTVRLSEAPSYGQPIIVFDPTSRGAIAYRELAKEVSGGSPQRIG